MKRLLKRLLKKANQKDETLSKLIEDKVNQVGFKVEYDVEHNSYNIPEIAGTIEDLGNSVAFVVGTDEPQITKDYTELAKAIDAYLAGRDASDEYFFK